MTAPVLADVYLAPEDVAKRLGISPTSVRRAIYRGDFPGSWKDGGILRVPLPAVEAYVAKRRLP